MKQLFKIIRKKFFGIILSITVIISLGVALLFGLSNGVLSVHKSIDNFIENNNYPDIKIITNLEDVNTLGSFNTSDYKSISSRLSVSSIIKKDDSIISVLVSTFEDSNLNDFYVWDQKDNDSTSYDILVEKKFASNNDIKLGDVVSLKIGDEYYSFFVTKIISIPEAIVSAPIDGMWGQVSDYGNVYINHDVLVQETNKLKDKLLGEVLDKENELNNEEQKGLEEFRLARVKIDDSFKQYNTKKTYYDGIKNELNNNKNELNDKKELLLFVKNEYVDVTNYLSKINQIINKYINAYSDLSENARKYINDVIDTYYSEVKIEDLEFISDMGYYVVQGKVNEVFDPNSSINQDIMSKIMMADIIKSFLDSEYGYYSSDEVTTLINQLNNDEVYDENVYNTLKIRLQLYSMIFGEITDDNILSNVNATRSILSEIHNASSKLPFDSFNDLYNALDVSRQLLPILYDSLKSKLKPQVQEIIDSYNSRREDIINQVDTIFNSNSNAIKKSLLIKDLIYNFTKNSIDEIVKLYLKDYTDDVSLDVITILNNLLNEIDSGINEINSNIYSIDYNLNSSYQLIDSNRITLENRYSEFIANIKNARDEISNKKDEINNIRGYESKYNEINIKVKNTSDREKTLNYILNNELKDIEVIDSYTYDYSPVKNSINYNIVGMENVSIIIPAIFYIVILIVLFLFVSLIIKQSKSEIAILRLLGISKNKIRLGYCVNNLIISIFGIILGLILGGLLMQFIVGYYKDFILLPTAIYEINFMSVIACIIVTVLVVEIATILATLELDRITPIEVLNKERYQNTKLSSFTKIITSTFSPFKKFSFLIYVRNKKNLILGIICTSATFALIFTSLAYVSSKDKIFSQYFDDRINYDTQVFEKGEITDDQVDEIRTLDYVKNADLLRYYNVVLKNGEKEVNAVVNAIENKNNYIKIFDKNNNKIDYPEDGIVLESHIASELGIKKGDMVLVDDIPFEVKDISFQSMGRVNYISIMESDKLNSSFDTVVMNMDNNKYSELVNKISDDDNYIYTVNYDSLREYNKKEFDSYVIPAIIIIIFTMIIGFIIIVNIGNYNLIDQRKNLSIFRSLGFRHRDISNNLFIQSLIQWVVSIIIGLPIGIALSKYVLKMVSSTRREYIYASGINEILVTVILLFVYIFISHIINMNKLKKINIIEEMKDKD